MRSLATKYRPKKFYDVTSQSCVTEILQNQLEAGDFKNAYLFCGGAGTGKTTTARIFANEINEGNGTPIEVDAASNNSVDSVRDIIADSKFKSLDSKYKVYIIDEVHMLSIGAFNALLKTLEEPPEGTIFILCTTDPQKIPATILSRVQRFNFTRIPSDQIVERLKYIIEQENNQYDPEDAIAYEDDALQYIAKLADGGMRDAITMLDKVIGYTLDIDIKAVQESLGVPDYNLFLTLWNSCHDHQIKECLDIINTVHMNGKDLKLFIRNYCDYALDLCKYYITKSMDYTSIPTTMENVLKDANGGFDYTRKMLVNLNKLSSDIKWDSNPKTLIQGFFIQISWEDEQ